MQDCKEIIAYHKKLLKYPNRFNDDEIADRITVVSEEARAHDDGSIRKDLFDLIMRLSDTEN